MNFVSEYPFYYLFGCFLIAFVYAYFLYRQQIKKGFFSKLSLSLLSALRFMSVFIICLLLLNILLKRLINETEKPLIIFALDNSKSIVSTKDSTEIKNVFIDKINGMNKRLSDKYNFKFLLFGSEVKQNTSADFSDKETDFSQLLSELENNFANQNTGALIIASDGIINKGTNPEYLIEKFKFPVYTIALGDTAVKKDLFIKKINHNQVVYAGNKFPVEVVIQSLKLKGKSSAISIWQNGIKKAEQIISVSSDNFIETINFVLESEKPGVHKYTVQAKPIEEEISTQNNTQSFIIDVIDNREKILILAKAPHPDIAAVKESIESNSAYEVESFLMSDFNKPVKPYSLVILHNTSISNTALLKSMNDNLQSYFIINPPANDGVPGVKISSFNNRFNDVEPCVNKTFSVFNLSDNLSQYIKTLPAVSCYFGNYSMNGGVNSVLFQKIGVVETENPLLFFNEINGQKTGAFLGDGIWRWRLRDYADHGNQTLFNELINKTVQYLSVKADKSFFRLFTKKIIDETEQIEFNAEVYNQSYELITEPEVNIALFDENGKQFNYIMSKNNNSYRLEAGFFPPGEYKYKASVKVNGKLFSNNGIINIKAVVAEQINTTANHSLLFQIANNSGGKLFYRNELEKLENELMSNELIKPITYSHKQLSDFIDLKWLFFLVLGLLTLEWFFRKRSGTI